MALLPQFATGQYYDLGRSPSSIHWNQTSTSWGRIIYPDYYTKGAASLYHYINEMAPSINYGLDYGPLKRMPMLLHTQNFRANGLVMRAPRRIELEVIPNINTYAEPWLKQLAVHEFRHAVQYGNLYRGFMKYVGYVIGEQAGLASLALVPTWLLEGDAVMTETQMSSFGRALQPSFTIEYRAYFTENEKNILWINGFVALSVRKFPTIISSDISLRLGHGKNMVMIYGQKYSITVQNIHLRY